MICMMTNVAQVWTLKILVLLSVEFHLVKKIYGICNDKDYSKFNISCTFGLKIMKLPSVKSLLIRALSNTTNSAPRLP
jgi:hypothetical protein